MLKTCTSTPQMLHNFYHVGGLSFSLCVGARASTSDAPPVGDPISCAVAILVVESPPTLYSWDQALCLRTLLLFVFIGLLPFGCPSCCWSSPGCFQDDCCATMKNSRQQC